MRFRLKNLFLYTSIICLVTSLSSNSAAQAQSNQQLSPEKKARLLEIYYKHQSTMRNLNTANLPLIICFSGTPGMGKTTTAKKIQDKLGAIVISSDEIRRLMQDFEHTFDDKSVSHKSIDSEYFYFLLDHLPKKNGLVVLDMSIDRTYREFLPWASKNGLPVFIIQMQLSPEETKKRIIHRNRTKDPEILTRLDKCFKDYHSFAASVQVDYELDNTDDPDLEKLCNAIKNKQHDSQNLSGHLVYQLSHVLNHGP